MKKLAWIIPTSLSLTAIIIACLSPVGLIFADHTDHTPDNSSYDVLPQANGDRMAIIVADKEMSDVIKSLGGVIDVAYKNYRLPSGELAEVIILSKSSTLQPDAIEQLSNTYPDKNISVTTMDAIPKPTLIPPPIQEVK